MRISNIKNDIESLIIELTKQNIPPEKIGSLKDAIEADQDAPEHKNQAFGNNVSKWFRDMSTKADTATWRISEGMAAGTAAGILLNILKTYYGWA